DPDAEPLPADLGDRRQVRLNRIDQRIEATAARTLRLLDDDLSHHRVLDRIEAVAVTFSATLNAAAWAISRWERGSALIRSVSTAEDRDNRLRGLRMGLSNEVYRLADFPHTADIL